jgi:hypothetical protein
MWPWAGILALAGCSHFFGLDSPTVVDAGAAPDGPVICGTTDESCASADVLRTCTDVGVEAVDTSCAWGCIAASTRTPEPHCAQIVPHGDAVLLDDLIPNGSLADVIVGSGTVIDTDTGEISSAASTVRDAGEGIIDGIEFSDRGTVGVFRFKSLTLVGGVDASGTNALALVADGAVTISANFDMRGGCSGNSAGPGGFEGGGRAANGAGIGHGDGGNAVNEGGGGGGYGGKGGPGGNLLDNGGDAYGVPRIANLVGGSGGGGGGDGQLGGVGGGGGGAIQIVSNTGITIAANDGINAGGCGGKAPVGDGSGGGGGAGGTILLEAPSITISGALAVNGGGGAGGGNIGTNGQAGSLSRTRAVGGTGGGGEGAATDAPNGGAAPIGTRGGGGGGGVGRMRFITRSGQVMIGPMAVLSPSVGDNTTTSQSTPDLL